MPTTTTSAHLSDDHIDVLVSAAWSWGLVIYGPSAALAQRPTEAVDETASETGRALRRENIASVRAMSIRGSTHLADRVEPNPYVFRPVTHLDPVEVIKAAHAADGSCSRSPSWQGSDSRRLLEALVTAATYRLEGYADAPWNWTRPSHRGGRPVGIATGHHPDVTGLQWIRPADAPAHWNTASLIVVTTTAAREIPAALPSRAGVFVIAQDEKPEAVWRAVSDLDMQALVLFWPTCQGWLAEQLAEPAEDFVEFRSL